VDDAQKAIVESPPHDRGMTADDESRRRIFVWGFEVTPTVGITSTNLGGMRGGSKFRFPSLVPVPCNP
jgi:hypothetical protein